MMKKIWKATGSRDDRYKQKNSVEVDGSMFEISFPVNTSTNRGRGSETKNKVMVMAQVELTKNKKGEETAKVIRYLKMTTIETFETIEMQSPMLCNVLESSTVLSDGHPSYFDFNQLEPDDVTIATRI